MLAEGGEGVKYEGVCGAFATVLVLSWRCGGVGVWRRVEGGRGWNVARQRGGSFGGLAGKRPPHFIWCGMKRERRLKWGESSGHQPGQNRGEGARKPVTPRRAKFALVVSDLRPVPRGGWGAGLVSNLTRPGTYRGERSRVGRGTWPWLLGSPMIRLRQDYGGTGPPSSRLRRTGDTGTRTGGILRGSITDG
jgi:hypothetical protein